MLKKQNDELTRVETLRQLYEKATEDLDIVEKTWEQLKKLRSKTNIQMAYEAAFEAFMAKKSWNPYDKLAHVDTSKRMFKRLIEKEPDNIEYRFLRLSMNYHLPIFLQESQWLEEDKTKLYRYFSESPLDDTFTWNAYILRFLVEKKLLSPFQLKKISAIYNDLSK